MEAEVALDRVEVVVRGEWVPATVVGFGSPYTGTLYVRLDTPINDPELAPIPVSHVYRGPDHVRRPEVPTS